MSASSSEDQNHCYKKDYDCYCGDCDPWDRYGDADLHSECGGLVEVDGGA